MPTYAYACTACDHAFDIQQSFTDDSLTICPECEGRLRKVFTSVGVSFKGSGFYRTDSREGAKKSAAAKSSSGEKSGEKSGSAASTSSSSSESSGSSSSTSSSASGSSASKSSASATPATT